MAIKRLGSPFPLSIFPAPDGAVSAADRAALAVGYPLAATSPAPPPPAPSPAEAPTIARVSGMPPAIIYYDELWGAIQPWQYESLDTIMPASRRSRLSVALVWSMAAHDRARCRDRMRLLMPLMRVATPDYCQRADALRIDIQDDFMPGLWRRKLIAEYDRLLGV